MNTTTKSANKERILAETNSVKNTIYTIDTETENLIKEVEKLKQVLSHKNKLIKELLELLNRFT
jgi:hypothetical protein